MEKERILLVDDEPNVLDGYRRGLRTQFKVTVAKGGKEGLEIIESSAPFAVVVSDMRMPEMNGVEFLKRVKRVAPDSVRMMLTGNADQETAIQAVNQGHIFRFLTKPCPPQTLTIALSMGIRQYHLIIAEKELLEKTLKGSVELLTEVLSLSDPVAFTVSSKVKGYLNSIQDELAVKNPWELEVAALLSPIGFLTLPPELKTKVNDGIAMTPKEALAMRAVPEIGARLLGHVPRLDVVAEMIRLGVDVIPKDDEDIPLEEDARHGLALLRLLFDYVRKMQTGVGAERALSLVAQQGKHDKALFSAVSTALQHALPELFTGQYVVLDLALRNIVIGDELNADVLSEDDRLLLASGSRITRPFLERLYNYRKLVGLKEPIQIRRFLPKDITSIPTPEE
jgi:response regulator RpfG family c-di-GMP phosphodiesterase